MSTGFGVFLGLDVGKGEHHAVGLAPAGQRLHDGPLPNSEPKLRALFDKLAKHGRLLVVVDQPATIGALPVAVARASGHQVAYLPGLAMRRVADLYPGPARPESGTGGLLWPARGRGRSSRRASWLRPLLRAVGGARRRRKRRSRGTLPIRCGPGWHRGTIRRRVRLVQLHGSRQGQPWATAAARGMLRRAGTRLELGRIRPHSWRHEFATNVLDASGGNIVIARDAGGWASATTVDEIYGHVDVHDPTFVAALNTVWGEQA